MGPDRRIGTELGGYRIVGPLGQGATSVVYLAQHVRLGRPAALKLLTPALGEADFRERFLRESQLAASLDHPNIVPVYDAGEEDGLLYIAMASVDGHDLKTLLAEEGPLPLRRALRIIGQVGSALDAAHARGLVHRDVKPANVLVAADDRTYLSDFGVVKELASNGTTRTGSFVGTIEYSAPEQIEGRQLDARADVYALACVLYECLAGTAPFHRPSEIAVLNAHLHAPPPKLTRAVPEIPAAVEPVIAKALSKSPLDRYGSCGEFVTALRSAAGEPRGHRRRLALSRAVTRLSTSVTRSSSSGGAARPYSPFSSHCASRRNLRASSSARRSSRRSSVRNVQHPRQGRSTRRPLRGILVKSEEEGVGNLPGKLGAHFPWVGRRIGEVSEGDLGRIATGEGRTTRDAFVQQAAERVDVARFSSVTTLDQLGREVMRRPQNLTVRGQPRGVRRDRQAKVRERCDPGEVKKHVRGFHVAMNDVTSMQRIEAASELGGQLDSFVQGQPFDRSQSPSKRPDLVERHDEEGHAVRLRKVENRDDVRRVDSLRQARLPRETRMRNRIECPLGSKDLQRNRAARIGKRTPLEHEPCRSLAEERIQPIVTEACSGLEGRDAHPAIIPGQR